MVPLRTWEKNSEQRRMEISKSILRSQVLQLRSQLCAEERERASVLLTERILGHQWYYLSDSILGFFPYGSEIDVCEILKDALAKGKKVYLPKVIGDEMLFYRVESLEDTVSGYKGIREPKGNTECYWYDETQAQRTLMLMPGVAFDKNRNRIGYGKGYYDRYLRGRDVLQTRTIAVAFACQMVKEIPAEELDVRPYQVIAV